MYRYVILKHGTRKFKCTLEFFAAISACVNFIGQLLLSSHSSDPKIIWYRNSKTAQEWKVLSHWSHIRKWHCSWSFRVYYRDNKYGWRRVKPENKQNKKKTKKVTWQKHNSFFSSEMRLNGTFFWCCQQNSRVCRRTSFFHFSEICSCWPSREWWEVDTLEKATG